MLGAAAVHDAGNATLVPSEGHVDRRREMSIEEGGAAVARRRTPRLQLRLRDKRCCCCAVCCTCAQPLQAGKCTLLYGEIGVGQRKGRFPKTMLLGPDWACAVVTVLLISSCTGIWLTFVAFPLHPAAGVVGILIAALVLAAFLVTSCSDPGIVPRQVDGLAAANEEGSADLPCNICQVLRPPGTIHCLACGVCIQDLDHHCPWTGKCIGKYTIRMFNTFIALLGLLIVYVVGIVFLSIAHFRNFGDL